MSTRSPSRRSLRRPIPPLIFLLVLALIALGVWWKVLERAEERRAAEAPPTCPSATAPVSLDPASVEIRVYNASNIEGLAARVGNELQGRGLKVRSVANDPTDRDVQGVGEIRFGELGRSQALYVAANFPGLVSVPDGRPGPVVDVALGPGYTGLLPAEQVPAAYATAVTAAASTSASCTPS